MAVKTNTLQEDLRPVKTEKTTKPASRRPIKRADVAWDQELQWFKDNRWVFEKHKGEWVAIKGDKLVAHGNYLEIVAFCDENNIEYPLLQYLPKTEQEWFLGLGNQVVPENFGKGTL